MSVQKFQLAIKAQIKEFLMARANVTAALAANTDPATVTVDDASKFHIEHILRNYPQVNIFDLSQGTDPIAYARVKSVDVDNKTITFSEPLTTTIPTGAIIKMAPGWREIQQVRLGDPTVLDSYPAVCIEPASKSSNWLVLSGITEAMTFNIITHVLEDNSEAAVQTLIRVTEDIEDLMMGNFHLKANMDHAADYNRSYNLMIPSVNYGSSNKNGAFLRSSMITLTADMFWMKFIAEQHPDESPYQ